MPANRFRKLVRRARRHARMHTIGRSNEATMPNHNLEPLEQRLMLSVVGGIYPTVDMTSRMNGDYNDNPQLETAPMVNGAIYTNDLDIADIGAGSGVLQ